MKTCYFAIITGVLISCGSPAPVETTVPPADAPATIVSEDSEASIDAYVQQLEQRELNEQMHDYRNGAGIGQYIALYSGAELVKIIRKEEGGETTYRNDFYLRNSQLVYCHIRESKKNCKGPLTCAWELRQYYINNRLVKAYKRGDVFEPNQPFDMESRNFVPDTESNLMAEDTLQRNFVAYVVSVFQGKP
jgi:hypothetical protein